MSPEEYRAALDSMMEGWYALGALSDLLDSSTDSKYLLLSSLVKPIMQKFDGIDDINDYMSDALANQMKESEKEG